MSIVTADGSGRINGEAMGLGYCTDEELQRLRALEMFRMKLLGIPRRRIAQKYRVTIRHVDRLTSFIPADQKARIRANSKSLA